MRSTPYSLATTIVSLVAVLLSVQRGDAQTPAVKDPFATAMQLYGAGQWSAARHEFDKASLELDDTDGLTPSERSHRIEIETFAALCAARLDQPDAGALLDALLDRYSASPYTNEVKFRAGVLDHAAGNYAEAEKMLGEVDIRRLAPSDRDQYRFTLGHSLFSLGEGGYEDARGELSFIDPDSSYRPHADYYVAYMDYAEGDYASAKRTFTALASHPSYSALVPYYLLQIAFMEGDYRYVTENAPGLIPVTAMPRKADLVVMSAQSRFRLEDYRGALSDMETYSDLSGEMSRAENYLVGFALYDQNRYSEAAEYLARATGADDSLSQNASYHLADTYLRLGDRGRAMQSFSIAANSGPDPVITEDALFNYGKLLYETRNGRFNEAVNILNRYLADYPSSPKNPQVWEYLIAAYYNSHDYEAAYNAIVRHPDPDNNIKAALQKITYFRALELYSAGDTEGALDMLETSATYRYSTKYTALASFWTGEILYYKGDYRGAIPRYEEYLRLSPTTEAENAMARYNLGYSNFNLGEWVASRSWFGDFLERHTAPDSYRADALNREGDIDHAERSYWRAIEKYDAAAALATPEKYYSAYQRAIMLGLVDRTDRKIESLQAIITAGEGDYVEDATYELGRTYISLDRYSDGARTLAGFVAEYPQSHLYLPALSNLGLAYLNMGEGDQSLKYYKMIVERAPWSREAQDAMVGIRGIYVDRDDVDGYFAYARESGVQTDVGEIQRDSLTFASAERIYLSGDGERAIAALENYVSGDARGSRIPTALSYLSGLYAKAQRWGDAADAYRRVASLTTDPAVASKAVEGYVTSVIRTGDGARIVAMVDEIAAMPDVPEGSLRQALYAKANVLREEGRGAEATDIYRTLAVETLTQEGAASAFRVIEYLYDTGDYAAAEQAIFAFSETGTSHGYWLAEAFLTLGDIYVRAGDTFQARATYQSIVDGYSPADDGIVASAKERIANL